LRSVGVRSSVGHGKNTRSSMLQYKVFISKLFSVNGLPSGAVVIREIPSLAHESRNDTVERRSGESESFLAGCQGTKVFSGLWDNVGAKFHDDAASGPSANGNIEKDLRVSPAGTYVGWKR